MRKIILLFAVLGLFLPAFSFFPFFYGARSLALGYSSLAFNYDMNALYINPALLDSLSAGMGAYQFQSSFLDYRDIGGRLSAITIRDLENFTGLDATRQTALLAELNELFAIQTQSYGPAARGESSKCDVVISDHPTFHPFVDRPDFLVLLSQPAYERYIEDTVPHTIVILDVDAVEGRPDLTYFDIPAIRHAEESGMVAAANMVILGALVQLSGVVSKEAMLKAIADKSPMGDADTNEKAFRDGLLLGKAFQTEG